MHLKQSVAKKIKSFLKQTKPPSPSNKSIHLQKLLNQITEAKT